MVYLSSTRYAGDFTKVIIVTTNDPTNPRAVLRCRGQVLTALHIEPDRVNFGWISRQDPTQYRTLIITSDDGRPIAPEVVPGGLRGLDAQICEIEPGSRYELVVSLTPPLDRPTLRDMLRIKTGVEGAPEQLVKVYGLMTPRLSVVPKLLTLPLEQADDIQKTLRLQWDGDKPGNILEVTSTIPQAGVRVENGDQEHRVVLSLPAGIQRSPGRHALTIKTDDPEVPILSVPIRFVGTSTRGRIGPEKAASEAKVSAGSLVMQKAE